MIKVTFSMEDVWEDRNEFVFSALSEVRNNGFIIPSGVETTITSLLIKPLWNRFHRANANFDNNEEGMLDFKNGLYDTLTSNLVEFFVYALHNKEFFDVVAGEDKDKPFQKQVISSIMPINQKVDQTLDETKLAEGTTGQQISELTPVGVAWNKALELYFTKNMLEEFFRRFKWLFVKVVNQYYDYVEEE